MQRDALLICLRSNRIICIQVLTFSLIQTCVVIFQQEKGWIRLDIRHSGLIKQRRHVDIYNLLLTTLKTLYLASGLMVIISGHPDM